MLELRNVNVYYGPIHSLKDISLTVKKGEIVTLIGANGAGKTTTLRSISGIVPADADSEIIFEGKDIHTLPPETIVRMGISHIPEGRRIFPGLTVRENLEMGAVTRFKNYKLTKEIEDDIERVYQLFPVLKERRNQLGWSLSGGEQQMLAIGRGLLSNPKLLLLDEPSLGLAPIIVQEVFEIIKKINAQGTTIFLVEQNASMALKVSNRGYVLENGKIILEGDSQELLNNEAVKQAYLGGR